MSAPLGVSRTVLRSVPDCPDPTAVLDAAARKFGARGTLLLESADLSSGRAGRSLVVVRSALRLAARGTTVKIEALNANGRALLPWVAERLSGIARVSATDDDVEAAFPPFAGGDEEARLAAPGPADALRVLTSGLQSTEPDPDAMP
ncbi:MAG: anthranilate synthase component I, partial [Gemmatimonadota bacterium]|nr:anthranilate synthase component I [Gemmatimonadota bacterium]